MKFVLANRGDGLGERLCAIFNGLIVSEYLGLDFKFCWPSSYVNTDTRHSVPEIYEIFSERFIDRHYIENSPGNQLLLMVNKFDFNALNKAVAEVPDGTALVVNQLNVWSFYHDYEDLKAKALSRLSYSKKITNVIDCALNRELPDNSIAIHIRSGDIVHGRFAETRKFTSKVIVPPLVSCILKSKINGLAPLIFGQELDFSEKLHKLGVARSSCSLSPVGLDRVESAFFDMYLMSRCSFKLSGSSGFSRFSEMVGTPESKSVSDFFSPTEVAESIYFELLSNRGFYTDPIVSYSAYYAHEALKCDSYDFLKVSLLAIAVSHSPGNLLYCTLLLFAYYKTSQYYLADKLFNNMILACNKNENSIFLSPRFKKILDVKYRVGSDQSVFLDCFDGIVKAAYNNCYSAKLFEEYFRLDKND